MRKLIEKIRAGGPAAIIASAFIGPGTVIVSTRVGYQFGYSLLWAVIFAVVSLMLLMEMASRIAIVSHKDLIEASIDVVPQNRAWKVFIQILMLLAVVTVCFAFQTGNLVGGSLGLSVILGIDQVWIVIAMSLISLLISVLGSSKLLELVMKLFVGFMGLIFVVTLVFVRPPVGAMAKGLIPYLPQGSFVLTLALIGTTLIGINLILHSITSKKWQTIEELSNARWDIVINILIGGLITFSIVAISATVLHGKALEGHPALAFTQSLEPVLGRFASVFGNLGLFAAGLSSAIAIPFTLKNITARVFSFEKGAEDIKAKIIGVVVIIFGATLAVIGKNPQEIIIMAQATSGFFLPVITVLILIVANNKRLLGKHTNNMFQNIVGILVIGLTLALGINGILRAIDGLLKLFA